MKNNFNLVSLINWGLESKPSIHRVHTGNVSYPPIQKCNMTVFPALMLSGAVVSLALTLCHSDALML